MRVWMLYRATLPILIIIFRYCKNFRLPVVAPSIFLCVSINANYPIRYVLGCKLSEEKVNRLNYLDVVARAFLRETKVSKYERYTSCNVPSRKIAFA